MKRALSWGVWSVWSLIGLRPWCPWQGSRTRSLWAKWRGESGTSRAGGKKSKKVYTNDNFPSAAPAAMEAPNPGPLAADRKEPSAKAGEAELEKQWRRRFAEARARLGKAELDACRLASRRCSSVAEAFGPDQRSGRSRANAGAGVCGNR